MAEDLKSRIEQVLSEILSEMSEMMSEIMSVILSEILSENNSVLPDSLGRYSDLIELTNVSDEPLLLSDYYLSDSLRERFRYRLPAQTLLPGAYLLVWCDSENTVEEDGTVCVD